MNLKCHFYQCVGLQKVQYCRFLVEFSQQLMKCLSIWRSILRDQLQFSKPVLSFEGNTLQQLFWVRHILNLNVFGSWQLSVDSQPDCRGYLTVCCVYTITNSEAKNRFIFPRGQRRHHIIMPPTDFFIVFQHESTQCHVAVGILLIDIREIQIIISV